MVRSRSRKNRGRTDRKCGCSGIQPVTPPLHRPASARSTISTCKDSSLHCSSWPLLQAWSPALRRAGSWGLAAYALCVWPANINHMIMDLARADGGLSLAYHIPRILAQPVLIWAALWAGGVTDWPWRRR